MSPEATLAATPRAHLFDYLALRTDGGEVVGRANAENELDLDRQLQRDGLTLIRATPSEVGQGVERLRMKRQELIAFTNQLATMIQAGVPLLQTLRHLAQHSRTKQSRAVVQSILRHIEGGASLSEAFAAHSGVFPGTYVAMVRSGEMSTSLPEVLRRQGEYMEWVREVKGITRQALIYPSALSVAIVTLVIILITFLIPRLVGLFPGGHEDLPGQTKFVIALSDFLRSNAILIVSGALITAAGFALMMYLRRTRLVLSRLALRIPRLGRLLEMLAVARFSTTAAALHKSGCDIVRTIEIAAQSCGNAYLCMKLQEVLEKVRGGEAINEAMQRVGGLDPYLVQLTGVGETSGRVGECLEFIADGYNREVPRAVKWALGLIEPMVLIFGGIIVAFLLLAAVLPIFKIYETLG